MTDLAQILKQDDSPVSPLEETGFGQSMRRRADRLPQIPARLSLSNLLRSMFTSAADWNDYIYGSVTGRQPVVGMPDLIHTPGQEDYRAPPITPGNIIGAGMGVVPTRGAPVEDRKGITKENYDAWKAELEKLRLAKENMTSPKPTPGGPEPVPRTRGSY